MMFVIKFDCPTVVDAILDQFTEGFLDLVGLRYYIVLIHGCHCSAQPAGLQTNSYKSITKPKFCKVSDLSAMTLIRKL